MKRGEIYTVDLGPGVGREASGIRPVVVISSDVANLAPWVVCVLPAVDSTDSNAKLGIPIPSAESGYSADISVLANQPLSLDPSRFTGGPVGAAPAALMEKISFALAVHLDLVKVKIPGP